MKEIDFKSILENLKGKKIGIYVRNLGQFSFMRGLLKDIMDEFVILEGKYSDIMYIPISEIVVILEKKVKA